MSLSIARALSRVQARFVLSGLLVPAAVGLGVCLGAPAASAAGASVNAVVPAPPTISVPADFAVVEDPVGSGSAIVNLPVTANSLVDPDDIDIDCVDGLVGVSRFGASLTVGQHLITCTASDDVGETSASFSVTVNAAQGSPVTGNTGPAPTADAGGPYTVAEGQPLHLDASLSSDADGTPLTYSWDLNGDGVYDDATGVSPTLSWQMLQADSVNDGPAVLPVRVRVDAGSGGSAVSPPTTLTVVNSAPAAFIGGAPAITSGLTVTYVLSSTDPSVEDQAAGFTYTVSYGDGVTDGPFHSGGAAVRQHVYAAPGSYQVVLTTVDKDGGVSAPATRTVTVAELTGDVCGSAGATLYVAGTAGNDVITVGPGVSAGTTAVTVNGVAESVATSAFADVVVDAGAGDDSVAFTGPLAVPRILHGGSGNDTLVAGDGPGVLVGGDGNDRLVGGAARDILIGGTGADVLAGNGDDDVLIPGDTVFDPPTPGNEQALCALQAEWTRTDVGFAGRVDHLLGYGTGHNGSTHLILSGRRANVGRRDCGDLVRRGPGDNVELIGTRP